MRGKALEKLEDVCLQRNVSGDFSIDPLQDAHIKIPDAFRSVVVLLFMPILAERIFRSALGLQTSVCRNGNSSPQ